MTRITTPGRPSWQFRPSDHTRTCGHRRYVHGPIVGMQEPGLLAKLFGRA